MLKAVFACVFAGVLSGCVAQPVFSVDDMPYAGSNGGMLKMKRLGEAGLIPVSISCRMPRSGPAAKSPTGYLVTHRWMKAPTPYPDWTAIVGDSPLSQAHRASVKAKGYRLVAQDSYYQTVAHQRVRCELWRKG